MKQQVAGSLAARRALFDGAVDAILFVHADGRFIDANPAATALLGYSHQEITAKRLGDFSRPDDPETAQAIFQRLLEVGSVRGERRIVTNGGELRHVEFTAIANILPGVHCLTFHDVTARKKAEDSVLRLSARLLRLQDDERRRIARQLHETTAQTLAAIRLNLGRIRRLMGDGAPAAEALGDSIALTEQAIAEVRTMSYLLHPPLMDEAGLLASLRWYVHGFEQRSGIAASIDAPESMERLPGDLETTIFRIVQEGLTNIQRHSGSSTATIILRLEPRSVHLEIRDRGRGLPADLREQPEALFASGVGIAAIHERVRELGGAMSIRSGDGTTLTVTLPVAP